MAAEGRAVASPLDAIAAKFWELTRNESGREEVPSRQPHCQWCWCPQHNNNVPLDQVDYATYMQLHLRLAKTLTDYGDEFDEADARESTQDDWRADCDR